MFIVDNIVAGTIKIGEMKMKPLKWVFCSCCLLITVNIAYAKKYTVHGQVLAKSQSGQYIPQYWKKNPPKFRVGIEGLTRTARISQSGNFKFKLDDKTHPPGKAVTFWVNKKDSKIVYPLHGKTFLPASSEGRIKLVLGFKKRKPVYYYSVQLLNTRNETRAIQLRNDLARDKIISQSDEKRLVPIYIEKYMVANMPKNGFEYKVKVGAFREKELAVLMKQDLERRYHKLTGLFITLRDFK